MYLWMYHFCISVCKCMFVSINVCMCIRIYACMYLYMYVCISACMHVSVPNYSSTKVRYGLMLINAVLIFSFLSAVYLLNGKCPSKLLFHVLHTPEGRIDYHCFSVAPTLPDPSQYAFKLGHLTPSCCLRSERLLTQSTGFHFTLYASYLYTPSYLCDLAAQCRFWQRVGCCVLLRGVNFWAHLAIMQRRAFSVVGSSAWNGLPFELWSLLMAHPSKFYISLKSFFFVCDWAGSSSE